MFNFNATGIDRKRKTLDSQIVFGAENIYKFKLYTICKRSIEYNNFDFLNRDNTVLSTVIALNL